LVTSSNPAAGSPVKEIFQQRQVARFVTALTELWNGRRDGKLLRSRWGQRDSDLLPKEKALIQASRSAHERDPAEKARQERELAEANRQRWAGGEADRWDGP